MKIDHFVYFLAGAQSGFIFASQKLQISKKILAFAFFCLKKKQQQNNQLQHEMQWENARTCDSGQEEVHLKKKKDLRYSSIGNCTSFFLFHLSFQPQPSVKLGLSISGVTIEWGSNEVTKVPKEKIYISLGM